MSELEIIVPLGPNSEDYAEFLKYTAEKFSSGEVKLKWRCVESVGCKRVPKGFKSFGKSKDLGFNSMNHAVAIRKAMKKVTSRHIIHIDSDVAILMKNWDKVVLRHLRGKFKCFGFSFGGEEPKYQNFPCVMFFAFDTEVIPPLLLDFRPEMVVVNGEPRCKRVRVEGVEASLMGVKSGCKIKCDTGWKLPVIIRQLGVRSKCLEKVMVGSKKRLMPFCSITNKKHCLSKPTHMAEYHYAGKVFGTHLQAGRSFPLTSTHFKVWKERINAYVRENKEYV